MVEFEPSEIPEHAFHSAASLFSVLLRPVYWPHRPPKPRIFITETTAPQASGDAAVGDAKGSLAFVGGTSPQNVEVIRAFGRYCPAVVVTSNRDKADYLVQFDHEAINPTTPFTHGNKVAVFDKGEDLVYSNSARVLSSAVKGACAAITRVRPASTDQ